MKQIILVFKAGGVCQILAHGSYGEGTEDFTLSLANTLGEITERHEGPHHNHAYDESSQNNQQKVSE